MTDIAFLATIVAFFALCVGYVNVCGRIIGPDIPHQIEDDGDTAGADALEPAA
ncbi:MAG TPA: hypothetical protein VHC63_01965 [Acidimicrobiales bacterium]|nr:hypothetical protein [Acidimicrobiales bacterium]